MRKLIAMVVALSFGLGAGFGSSALWSRAPVLPYCKVAQNAEAYHMKFVRVKAKVYFTRDAMYIHEECDPEEALAASVEFADGPVLGSNVNGYLDDYALFSKPTQTTTAEAIVEGEFNAEASTGCWAPKFRIIASKVELISPVKKFVPAD
jgi:hypothetical protein